MDGCNPGRRAVEFQSHNGADGVTLCRRHADFDARTADCRHRWRSRPGRAGTPQWSADGRRVYRPTGCRRWRRRRLGETSQGRRDVAGLGLRPSAPGAAARPADLAACQAHRPSVDEHAQAPILPVLDGGGGCPGIAGARACPGPGGQPGEYGKRAEGSPIQRLMWYGARGAQARMSWQNRTHLPISASSVEPSGTGYSISMVAWNLYFSFFIMRRISLMGVSPWPNGMLGPLLTLRSFMWTWVTRSWCSLIDRSEEHTSELQ